MRNSVPFFKNNQAPKVMKITSDVENSKGYSTENIFVKDSVLNSTIIPQQKPILQKSDILADKKDVK